jgi:aldehyde dehydrogenase (NAD+)
MNGSSNRYRKFYIDGQWVDPVHPKVLDVVNPATELPVASISLGSAEDVDLAVNAARRAFPGYSSTSVEYRVQLLTRVYEIFKRRQQDFATAIMSEIGCPITFSLEAQIGITFGHFEATISALQDFHWSEKVGSSEVLREPIGVVGLITPWNWPINQVICKVLPALAVGCTIVLKPSEVAPLDATLFAEVLEEAGLPPGVFNLVNGDGPTVGEAIAAHPGIDAVSFTGSTRAGTRVAKVAADTVKRITQELGGKSANIVLDDADLEVAVREGVLACFANSGQSCDAPTRLLVSERRYDEAVAIATKVASGINVGDPTLPETRLGPVVSKVQFDRIQKLINIGIAEGAKLVVGGPGRPAGFERGYFVKPTIFAAVNNQMTIAREEIFGPVLCILAYEDEQDAVRIANDTPYGLAGYVASGNTEHARRIASRLQVGSVYINYPPWDARLPFGGYKQSGNGRESGRHGMFEYLEVKAVVVGG